MKKTILALSLGLAFTSSAFATPESTLETFAKKHQAECGDMWARIIDWQGDIHLGQGGISWAGGGNPHAFVMVTPEKYIAQYTSPRFRDRKIFSYAVIASTLTDTAIRIEARLEITDSIGRKTSASTYSDINSSEFDKQMTYGDKEMLVAINGPVSTDIMDTKDDGRAMIKELNLKEGDEVQEMIGCSILSK
jgi:hypothetical protein